MEDFHGQHFPSNGYTIPPASNRVHLRCMPQMCAKCQGQAVRPMQYRYECTLWKSEGKSEWKSECCIPAGTHPFVPAQPYCLVQQSYRGRMLPQLLPHLCQYAHDCCGGLTWWVQGQCTCEHTISLPCAALFLERLDNDHNEQRSPDEEDSMRCSILRLALYVAVHVCKPPPARPV